MTKESYFILLLKCCYPILAEDMVPCANSIYISETKPITKSETGPATSQAEPTSSPKGIKVPEIMQKVSLNSYVNCVNMIKNLRYVTNMTLKQRSVVFLVNLCRRNLGAKH